MAIDIDELETALRRMKPRQQLFETVRRVLLEQGRWKNAPRGWATKLGKEEPAKEEVKSNDLWGAR